MNIQEQIINAAINELNVQSFGTTEQYMQIHDVVRVEGIPQVARLDMTSKDDYVIVYFPVQDEKFYLAVGVDIQPEIAIRYVDTENNNSVYLRATSENKSSKEIASMTNLELAKSWDKGESRGFGTLTYKYNGILIEPNPEPDTFENKIKKLIDYLEKDKEGVLILAEQADAYIAVDVDIHFGNGNLHGPYMDNSIIKRMSSLNLAIQFYQWVQGNPFK